MIQIVKSSKMTVKKKILIPINSDLYIRNYIKTDAFNTLKKKYSLFFIANKIIEKKLSVRQAENFVKIFKKKKLKKTDTDDINIKELENSISNKIGLSVSIHNKKNNKGKISFEYKSLDQLNKIIEIIKSNY